MKKILISATVISFIEWFNKENIEFLHKDMKCEVHIACDFEYMSDTDENRTKEYIKKLKSEGVVLHNVCFDRNPFGKRNVRAYKQLKEIINKECFDLIHCHTPTASVMVRLATRKKRQKGTIVMYTCHGFHFHNASPKKNWLIYYPIEKYLSRYCDYLVTINKEDYQRAQTFHCKNVRYIHGVGVDINKIKETDVDKNEYKRNIGIPQEAIMLLSVGELIERKNHEVIIRALNKIKRDDIYYVICGKGPLHNYLNTLAKELEVSERVLLLGFRNDIPEICKVADICAFPSKIEGLGLAGIEAMAAGTPIVASNVHGIIDYVIDGETGYTCSPNDIDSFAYAIEKLAENKDLRETMKEKCQKAVEPYEIKNALNEMWDIYREILDIKMEK